MGGEEEEEEGCRAALVHLLIDLRPEGGEALHSLHHPIRPTATPFVLELSRGWARSKRGHATKVNPLPKHNSDPKCSLAFFSCEGRLFLLIDNAHNIRQTGGGKGRCGWLLLCYLKRFPPPPFHFLVPSFCVCLIHLTPPPFFGPLRSVSSPHPSSSVLFLSE